MHYLRVLAALLLLPMALGACATGEPWVELGGQRFTVEIANDQASRVRGLMYRDAMPQDHGMLFVHERLEPQAYWMRNTRIPLDILYFDADRRLVSAHYGVPTCSMGERCPSYPSRAPALYVLEVNAGVARRLDLQPGEELVFAPGLDTSTR